MNKGIQQIRQSPTPGCLQSALGLLGQRWTLRIVWELRAGGLTFRALRDACDGVSPSVLQARLHDLRRAGLLEQISGLGYRLSADGEQLFRILAPLDDWSSGVANIRKKKL
jgi:DNA-binding HxlR family transcriptional regulator